MASVAVNRPIHVAGASVGAGTRYLAPLTVLTSLFFMWGFLTCLNDILIPHLKGIFKLSYFGAMLIQFSFFIAYAVMSIPSGLIVKRFGYKRSILIGLGTMSVACLLFSCSRRGSRCCRSRPIRSSRCSVPPRARRAGSR
jgi:fucose permease